MTSLSVRGEEQYAPVVFQLTCGTRRRERVEIGIVCPLSQKHIRFIEQQDGSLAARNLEAVLQEFFYLDGIHANLSCCNLEMSAKERESSRPNTHWIEWTAGKFRLLAWKKYKHPDGGSREDLTAVALRWRLPCASPTLFLISGRRL